MIFQCLLGICISDVNYLLYPSPFYFPLDHFFLDPKLPVGFRSGSTASAQPSQPQLRFTSVEGCSSFSPKEKIFSLWAKSSAIEVRANQSQPCSVSFMAGSSVKTRGPCFPQCCFWELFTQHFANSQAPFGNQVQIFTMDFIIAMTVTGLVDS